MIFGIVFFFQAEDGIRDADVTGVQTCALPISSPEFAAMWATQDVANPHYLAKVFRHPLYPRLEMTSTSFAVQGMPGTRMVVYTPDNEATRAAVEELVADPVQHRFPCWPAHQARTRDLLTI